MILGSNILDHLNAILERSELEGTPVRLRAVVDELSDCYPDEIPPQPTEVIGEVVRRASERGLPVFFEPRRVRLARASPSSASACLSARRFG